MKRSLGIERTFWLGQFRNIKVTDYITDIPDDLALNEEVISLLRTLQLINIDKVYLNYIKESPAVSGDYTDARPETIEEAVEALEEVRLTTFEKLKESFASEKEDKKELIVEKENKDE